MRVGWPGGGACHNGRASDPNLIFLMVMELAEPGHLSLKADEKPHRKDANHLTPEYGT